jgi:filamentous hemagglutinin family protein
MAPRSVFDKRRIILAGTSLAALTLAGAAHAGPSGGSVSAGSASIAGDGTGHVTVTQTSDRAILDWNSFSIGTGESTRFIQPGSTSVAVNRVTGADPSSILGSLSANGRVVLINRNGIAFGKDATVDVGGLVATTADIDRQAFMATGSLNFSGGSLPGASIVNEGRITVRDAGLAALVAPSVRNSGTIIANLGRVALGAGTGFTVDFYGDGLVSFAPDGIVAATIGDGGTALVENSGVIEASGGKVLLSAAAAREVVNASVNVSGVVRAGAISRKGGSIVLSGSGSVTATGTLVADSEKQGGGTIAISGGSVSLGGLISASGTDGGMVTVEAEGLLSLAETVAATGRLGNGGTIRFDAGRIIETATSRNDASGAIDGGAIRVVTEGGLATSGTYAADGVYGRGGRIDLSGASVSLLSTHLSARGRLAGGLVRIGGAFQGGKTPDAAQAYHSTFVGRWGTLETLPNADTLFVGNAAAIDVSSSRGDGGTAVFWSDTRTTFLGSVDARGGRGGSVEISSADDLRQAALDRVITGAGGHLLLDPKNIVIGTVDDVESWQYAAVLGAVYANSGNPDILQDSAAAALDTFDSFGSSVALNAAGTRMAVGLSGDDGGGNLTTNVGAVYLFSFADGDFSNGMLTGIVGKGFTGGKNVDVAQLAAADAFGTSVALNATGDLLAVGALGDDGKNEDASGAGAAYLLRFTDGNFSGGTHVGTIGKDYSGAGDIAIAVEADDGFGRSISLNGDGDLMAIGAWNDSGNGNIANKSGAAYLVRFADTDFGGGTHAGTIGYGYFGAGDVNLALDVGDYLGVSVALNAAGDRLAIGAHGDDGSGNSAAESGAIHVIGFSDTTFSDGEQLGTIGKNYVSAGDTNVSTLVGGDMFGYAVAMNAAGTRVAGTALGDNAVTNNMSNTGAVHLLSFANTDLSGGTYEGMIGRGYTGGKNVDITELEGGDMFGFGLAFNATGDRLAVGAYSDDGGGNSLSGAGGVYLMRFADGNFSGGTVAGVVGRDAWRSDIGIETLQAGDRLGIAVALNAVGDRLAVGAMYDAGALDDSPTTGAVYLFSFTDGDFSGGTLTGIVGKGYTGGANIDVPRLQTDDFFGSALAFNAEGTRLAIGAIGDDGSDELTSNAGAVYLLDFIDRDFSAGEIRGIVGKGYSGEGGVNDFDVTDLESLDRFGRAIALNAAGDRMAIGATSDDGFGNSVSASGAVRLFTLDSMVSLAGTIGAGYVGANDLNIGLADSDQLGNSVSLNAAGDRLAIGAIGDDASNDLTSDAGAVYLISFTSTDFTGASHTGTIGKGYAGAGDVSLALDASDQLGIAVSLNAAGDRLAIGAPGDAGNSNTAASAGAVYLLSFTDTDFSGGTLSARIGSGYSGGKNLSPANLEVGDRFGFSVALNAAGDRLAVGSFLDGGASNRTASSGAIYLFGFTDGDFSGGQLTGLIGNGYQRHQDIALNPGPDAADQFGISAALNGAGDLLAVGAFGDHGVAHGTTSYGAVYLFSFSDDQFSDGALEAIIGKGYSGGKNINLTGLETGDGFGFSVALNDTGDRMAVGAWGDDGFANGTSDSGAVHLFSFSDDSFSNGARTGTVGSGYVGTGDVAVSLGTTDFFGSAVALNASGSRLAVGAYRDDGATNATTDAGAVHLFSFADADFGGGAHTATIGNGYSGASGTPMLEGNDYFGISVALNGAGDRLAVGATGDDGSGNSATGSGAIYLFSFTNSDFGGGAYAGTIGKGYSGGKNVNLASLEDNDQFGRSVALDGDGNYLAAGANLDDGSGNSVQNAGAIHLFSFTDTSFSGGTLKGTIGAGYTGTWDTSLALDVDDNFGASAALSANGLRLAVGANGDDGANNAIANSGAVYLFSTERVLGFTYADHLGATVNIAATSLAALLASGTNLTLQASNDITVSAAITVDNSSGDGGDLTLQAGRSVLLNANITTDNGDLTLIANDTLANGVVDAYRDSGAATITMGVGTAITAGTGTVTLDLRSGAGKTNTASGDITLRAITAGALTVTSAATAGDILLNGNVTTSGVQDYTSERDIKLAASTTLTVTGAATLSMDAARQVSLTTGAKIENTYAGGLTPFAAIDITANRRVTADAGTLSGIDLSGAIIRTAAGAAGSIALSARCGAADGRGINMLGGSTIESLGSGTITLHGTSGTGSGGTTYGVFLHQSSQVVGTNGDIEITGEAVGSGVAPGLYVFSGSQVRTTGTGDIALIGSAVAGGQGVWIASSSAGVHTISGDISITATSGDGGQPDFAIGSGGTLGSANTNDITINADTIGFTGTVSGNGILTIQSRTDGRTIGLGDGAGDLALTATSLANIQNGFSEIVIGNADAGAITVGNGLSAFNDNLRLESAAALAIGGTLSTGSNRLTLDIAGATSQTAAITADKLLLMNATGAYTLTNTGNAIGTLAGDTGTITLTHGGSGNLTVGTIDTTAGIDATSVAITTTQTTAGLIFNQDVTTTGAQTYGAPGTITVNAGADLAVSGKATLALTAGARILLSGGTLANSYTADSDAFEAITLKANEAGTGTGSGDAAIKLAGGARISTAAGGGGNISLLGKGGASVSHGIFVDGSSIESLGAGTLSLTGTGGTSTGGTNMGIYLKGVMTGIIGNTGAMLISGTGGASSGPQNYGVHIHDGAIIASIGTGDDAAAIDVIGAAGGTGSGATNIGVYIADTGAMITSIDGDISVTGTGAAASTSNNNIGVRLINDARIESTGTTANAAKITVIGNAGGTGALSANNQGVSLQGAAATITSAFGDISITGTGSATAGSANNHGIHILEGAHVTSTGSAPGAAKITLSGHGGGDAASATSNTNIGIYLSSANTYIESVFGDITMTGTGGAGSDGADAHHYGIQLGLGTQVRSTGSDADAADIIVSGTGGSGTGNKRNGVYLNAVEALQSDAGNISITARGGVSAGGTGNDGLYVSGVGTKVQSSSGEVIVDAAKGGGTGKDFNNLTGNTAVQSTTGRWIIYLTHPDNSTLNNLASGNLPIWGKTQSTLAPASVGAGNRYVFANQPTLTVSTSFSDSKTYGTEYTFPTPTRGTNYSISGIVSASSYQSVWTQETLSDLGLSGAPEFSSSGGAADANVAGSPYAISIANGTLASSAGYAFGTPSSTGTLTVTPKTLTITGVTAAGKDYDGDDDTDLSGGALDGVVGSDDVEFTAGAGVFASKNVGTWVVTATGYTLSGSDAANYELTQPTVANATISAKALTLTGVSAAGKDYDGDADADLSGGSLVGIVGSEDVEFTAGSGTFSSKNVGTWMVTATGYALTGDDAGNYTLTQPTVADAAISAKVLTLTGVSAAGKDYDGNDAAALSGGTLVGIVGGEDVAFAAGTGTFSSKNVGTWTVTASGYTLSGDDAGNYTLTQPAVANAAVSAKALTLGGITATDKDYDGDTDADLSGGTLFGVVGSEDVSFVSGSGVFASRNAGTWSITTTGYALSGDDAGNYTLAQPTVANATIVPKAITLSGVSAAGKEYDGDADAVISGGALVGTVGGDDVEFSAGSGLFASKNAGTWSVTASGYTLIGDDAGNYTLTQPTIANATISPRTLNAGVTADGKIYDGTRDATLTFSTSDVVAGDSVTFAYGAQFADKAAGTGKTVSLTGSVTLTGTEAANYTLALDPGDVSALAADISARTLTVSSVGALNKIYDGGTSAGLSFATSDILSSDTVTFDYTANFADKNAGAGKGVSASGVSLSGADGGNYVLVLDAALLAGLTADIDRKALTLETAAAVDKTYDGSRNVTLDFTTGDLVSGDDIGFLYEALAADGNAGTGKAVTVTGGAVSLSGADADNYDLGFDPALLTGLALDIAARTLNVTAVAALDKVYDGTTTAALAITATGLVGGDDAVFGYDVRFADKNVGVGKPVTVAGGISLSGGDADNYVIVLDPALLGGLSADIIAKTLSITDVLALAKTYDGSRGADLAFVTDDIVSGDSVGFGYEALFADKNAGTGKAIGVTGGAVALTGADAGNYALSLDAALLLGLSADIGRKTLTVTNVAASDKTYDGTRNVPLDFTTADILGGDDVVFDYEALTADRNAGTSKVVAVGGVSLAGEDAGNYDLALDDGLLGGLTTDISAKALTVVVDDQSRPRFQPNPAFTYHLVGLADGDDASVVSGVTFLTAAAGDSLVGQYAIEASGGSASNYVLAYMPGTLTVTGHLIPAYDQDRIQHVPGSLSGSDGFGGIVSIAPAPTLHMLSGYADMGVGEAAPDGRGPFCSDPGNRTRGQRLLPYLQLNMSGRTLYCLGSPSRFVQ